MPLTLSATLPQKTTTGIQKKTLTMDPVMTAINKTNIYSINMLQVNRRCMMAETSQSIHYMQC